MDGIRSLRHLKVHCLTAVSNHQSFFLKGIHSDSTLASVCTVSLYLQAVSCFFQQSQNYSCMMLKCSRFKSYKTVNSLAVNLDKFAAKLGKKQSLTNYLQQHPITNQGQFSEFNHLDQRQAKRLRSILPLLSHTPFSSPNLLPKL